MELTAMLLMVAALGQPDVAARCAEIALDSPHPGIVIESSEAVEQSDNLPAFCRIRGTIEPSIGFEARFPLDGWNGNYFQAGCGGFCGLIEPDRETRSNAINHALRRGHATITTNGGHEGESLGDGRWALDNPAAEEVYAHRVLPLTHEAGHRLIKAVYDAEPAYSYFSGCSNGGRLGAMAAQRYPELFDGIVVGCPVLTLSVNGGAFGAWVLQSNSDGNGGRILDYTFVPKLEMLEQNALAQCDAADGRADGAIAEPALCRVSLEPIATCEAESRDDCLTAAEKRVVSDWYRGPVTSSGQSIFPGMPAGSERYWGYWYLGNETFNGVGTLLAEGYGTYLGFAEDPAGYSALQFDFDTDVARLAAQGELFDALDPDLTAFRDAGGKMLMWHGMADPLVLPDQSRGYYEAVLDAMGKSETAAFLRLFEAPGLGHCWELPAGLPDQMDLLAAVERWVEEGVAPDEIAVVGNDADGNVIRQGSLRPYPQFAEYAAKSP